jgi:hypothetical protein
MEAGRDRDQGMGAPRPRRTASSIGMARTSSRRRRVHVSTCR